MEQAITTLVSAKAEAGNVGDRNSKMPGSSWAIPTTTCKIGSKLADVLGSVCHGCYAKKSERMYPSVRQGWGDNYLKATRMIAEHPDRWAAAMAFQVKHLATKSGEPWHRWFDSGDLQSVEMLAALVLVCKLTPDIRHWLPTREAGIVKQWRAAGGRVPSNLVIRLSSTMVGDPPRNAPNTSTVHRHGEQHFGHECPSTSKKHRRLNKKNPGKPFCGPCRACWDSNVSNVSYPLHP
jgi:hypothetical protein